MRVRSILVLMMAGMLIAAGVASAQDSTSDYTTTLGGYTTSTPSDAPVSGESGSAPGVAGAEAEVESGALPAVASQTSPAGDAPDRLAFTGAEPLLLIALGMTLAGGATVLLARDRRRATNRM